MLDASPLPAQILSLDNTLFFNKFTTVMPRIAAEACIHSTEVVGLVWNSTALTASLTRVTRPRTYPEKSPI